MMMVAWRKSPPGPPCCSSSQVQRKPAAPALRQASRSTMPCSAQRFWFGAISLATNWRNAARNRSWSSENRVRSILREYHFRRFQALSRVGAVGLDEADDARDEADE